MTASHARTCSRPVAAWALLAGTGATSVTYNVVHAVSHSGLDIFLALLYGVAPVYAAALLSHLVAEHFHAEWPMRVITLLVMLGAMALSIGATASVVRPAAGAWMQWLFGAVLDAAALVALRVILAARSRKAGAAAELAAALARARDAGDQAVQLQGELAAARAEVQDLASALNRAMTKTVNKRVRSGVTNRKPSPMTPRVPSDVATQAEALKILGEDSEITGGELGRRLGMSESYGCRLKKRLAGAAPNGQVPSARP